MDKLVTITLSGITQTVPEADLSLYTRAGYKIVETPSTPVEVPEEKSEELPVKKSGKK